MIMNKEGFLTRQISALALGLALGSAFCSFGLMKVLALVTNFAFARLKVSASRQMQEIAILPVLAVASHKRPAQSCILLARWRSSSLVLDHVVIDRRSILRWRGTPALTTTFAFGLICFRFLGARGNTLVFSFPFSAGRIAFLGSRALVGTLITITALAMHPPVSACSGFLRGINHLKLSTRSLKVLLRLFVPLLLQVMLDQ